MAPDCEARLWGIDPRRCSTTDHATSNHAAKRCRAIDAASAASYDEPSLEKFDKFEKRNDRNAPRATCCTLFSSNAARCYIGGHLPGQRFANPANPIPSAEEIEAISRLAIQNAYSHDGRLVLAGVFLESFFLFQSPHQTAQATVALRWRKIGFQQTHWFRRFGKGFDCVLARYDWTLARCHRRNGSTDRGNRLIGK